jgi:hypothetical protein
MEKGETTKNLEDNESVGRDLIPKLCWYVSRSADDSIARFTEF